MIKIINVGWIFKVCVIVVIWCMLWVVRFYYIVFIFSLKWCFVFIVKVIDDII